MTQPEKRPRLLIVTDDSSNGGTAHLARQLSVALASRFKVNFAGNLGSHPASALKKLERTEIELHDYSVRNDNILQQAHGAAPASELLNLTKPDIILCAESSIVSLLALKNGAARAQIPFVIAVNSIPTSLQPHIERHLAQAEASFQAAAATVFVCESHRAAWHRIFRGPSTKTAVISTFCDDVFFEEREPERRRCVRAALGAGDDDLVVFTAAQITQDKGQLLSLRALKHISGNPSASRIRFIHAGQASARELDTFHKQVEELGLGKQVSYLGERTDINELLDASDCFVLVSFNEGAPLSVIEALAKGVPVIASNVGDIANIVAPSCGVVVSNPAADEAGCVNGLAEQLVRFAGDRSLLAGYSRQARIHAQSLFRSDIAAGKYIGLLSDIYSGHKAGITPHPDSSARPGLGLWQSVNFANPAAAWNVLLDGWSESEPRGVWATGPVSRLKISIASADAAMRLRFLAKPFVNAAWPGQLTEIYAGDNHVGTWRASRQGTQTFDIVLDPGKTGSDIELRLEHKKFASPYDLGNGADRRQLSFFVKRMFVLPAAATVMHGLKYRALRAGLM